MTTLPHHTQALKQFFRGFVRGLMSLPMHPRDKPVVHDFQVELRETATQIELQAQIPGMAREDIHFRVADGVVSVCATLLPCRQQAFHGQPLCSQACFAANLQRLPLSAQVDSAAAVARYQGGQLQLILPKKRAADRAPSAP